MRPRGRTLRSCSSGTGYDKVHVTKVGPCIQMVVFGIGVQLWFPGWRTERGNPQGVPLLSF